MRRSMTIAVLSLLSLSFSISYFMGFDTRRGVSFGLSLEGVRLYTGYRYSGVEAFWSFGAMYTTYDLAVDPFGMNFETGARLGFKMGFIGSSVVGRLEVSPTEEASQVGLFLVGLDVEYSGENLFVRAQIGTVPLALLYYSGGEMDFHYFFPPSSLEDLVMNSRLDFSMGVAFGSFKLSLGYMVNYGFLKGVPTPLLNLNGIYLKVTMESEL